jgi:heme A synthase
LLLAVLAALLIVLFARACRDQKTPRRRLTILAVPLLLVIAFALSSIGATWCVPWAAIRRIWIAALLFAVVLIAQCFRTRHARAGGDLGGKAGSVRPDG